MRMSVVDIMMVCKGEEGVANVCIRIVQVLFDARVQLVDIKLGRCFLSIRQLVQTLEHVWVHILVVCADVRIQDTAHFLHMGVYMLLVVVMYRALMR